MKTCVPKIAGCSALLFLAAACGDGGVGEDDCVGERVRCRVSEKTIEPRLPPDEISTRDVREVSATWVRKLPALPPAVRGPDVIFTSDLEGAVWLFVPEKSGVAAMRLDAEGEVAERTTIAPPREFHISDAGSSQLYAQQQSAVGPTIRVDWTHSVPGHAAPPPGTIETSSGADFQEWIKFGASLDDKPRRFVPMLGDAEGGNRYFSSRDQVAWAEDGGMYVLHFAGTLEKYDSKRQLEWKQAAARNASLVDDAWLWFSFLDDGHLAFFRSDGTSVVTYAVDTDGNFAAASAPLYNISASAPHPIGAELSSAGPTLVTADANGDLYMLRVRDDSLEFSGALVRRDDYLHLEPKPSALDRARTLYTATKTGGREPKDQRHMLCRVPVAGAASCVKLAPTGALAVTDEDPARELAINADGVVFLRVGTELARIEFPEP